MSYITAYGAIIDPWMGRLPLHQSIKSIYDQVDEIVVVDASKYDKVDLSMYGKVRYVKTVFPPFDNPFGSLFTTALKLVNSDTCVFMDWDEIIEWRQIELRPLIKQFPLEGGAGIAFPLINYYCSRNYVLPGCSSKGAHVFRNREDLYHDSLAGYWQHHSLVRRTNLKPDSNDGVRLCNSQGVPISHFQPLSPAIVAIHHTSHLDPAGKFVRSIVQFNHTSALDLPEFCPYDMRLRPELTEKIIKLVEDDIDNGDLMLYDVPSPFDYQPVPLLEEFIAEANIKEFDPTTQKDYERVRNLEKQEAPCEPVFDTEVVEGQDFTIGEL